MTMCDRPMWPPGAEITAQGFDAFQAFCQEHDPNMRKSYLELVDEYDTLSSVQANMRCEHRVKFGSPCDYGGWSTCMCAVWAYKMDHPDGESTPPAKED